MIELRHLRKEYEGVTPLEDVSITINNRDSDGRLGCKKRFAGYRNCLWKWRYC